MREETTGLSTIVCILWKYTFMCALDFSLSRSRPTVERSRQRDSMSSSSGLETLARSFLTHSCIMRSVSISSLKSSPMRRTRPRPWRLAFCAM